MRIFKTVALTSLTTLALALVSATGVAQAPSGYPVNYGETVAAATREGKVVIYGATDIGAANPLIKDFRSRYPGVKVEYYDMQTTEVYNRFVAESARGGSADVLWSSAMDLQIKLVNDGYALAYRSPEISQLPEWAVWRNEAFGTTFEPAVFVYNKQLLAADEVPRSHADFVRLLREKTDKFKGKVTTYDIERSGVGFLLFTQDSRTSAAFWDLVGGLGASDVRLQANTSAMMESIGSGEHLLGYNMLGSYAMEKASRNPVIGVVVPSDYTLVLSRIMFISKSAKNPNAARLWVDHVLSHRGQTLLANGARLFSIRADVAGEATATALTRKLGASLKPIVVGPGLLVYLDQAKRLEFLKQWQQATGNRK